MIAKKKGFTSPNFSRKNLGGFTLIELLVVIAIIGLLASIVLVSVGGARTRARDARVITSMAQLRSQAEIYRAVLGNYAGTPSLHTLCTTVDCSGLPSGYQRDICTLCADVDTQNEAQGPRPTFQATTTEYCAFANLASSPTRWFCIDEGRAIDTTTNPATTHCNPAATPPRWDCP